MIICSLAICFIIKEVTFIDITIGMEELSYSTGFPMDPLSLVLGSVFPDLNPLAMLNDFLGFRVLIDLAAVLGIIRHRLRRN
jgi:hypothetical protein